ncbi:MAG TPA: hypothetical protein VEC57_16180 [Candidatus Limnocylindrales bacterium]|nr:hypothetical protein [Candidatus Limnocylindrales bacterium]
MRSGVGKWPVVVLALAAYGCAAREPYNPFRIEKDVFRQQVHTIALMPTVVPNDAENVDQIRAKFESLITARLGQAGFATIPSGQTAEVFERVRSEVGGTYDPVTGELDAEKEDATRKKALAQIAERFGADAVLHSRIVVVKAGFRNGAATWLGTTQRIEHGGSLAVRILGGVTVSGTVGATGLAVTIEDTTGTDLYLDSGGIEVLSKYSFGSFQQRPVSELFLDEVRNAKAVELALGDLSPPSPERMARNEQSGP